MKELKEDTFLLTVEANMDGRDFVCGDLHGSFSCLDTFFKCIDFDKSKDRLFVPGDLIDRGPDSLRCLALLAEPWFYACSGNHELMMKEYFEYPDIHASIFWTNNGGAWATANIHNDTEDTILIRDIGTAILPKLPTMITVNKKDGGKFHLVHAELPKRFDAYTDEMFCEANKHMLSEEYGFDGPCVFWGREIFYHLYNADLNETTARKFLKYAELNKFEHLYKSEKLSTIYSGHTPCRKPVIFDKLVNLDTCAFGSYKQNPKPHYGLTITEPATGKFWFANDREFNEIEPFIIR